MEKQQPLVTIYMPTKNRFQLACRAIESVLNQTYQNIELIVVDDGSELEQYEGLRDKYKDNSNIQFLRNEQSLGACASRNKAIKHAQGEFITGLDDDDYFKPNRIEYLLQEYDDEYAFVCDSMFKCKENNRIVTLKALLEENIVGNQILVKKQRVLLVNGFDENLPAWQDYDLWIRLIEKFGDAKKIKGCSQYIDTSHLLGRISSNKTKLNDALQIFFDKHKHLYPSTQMLYRKIRYAFGYKDYNYLNYRALLSSFNLSNLKINIMTLIILLNKIIRGS